MNYRYQNLHKVIIGTKGSMFYFSVEPTCPEVPVVDSSVPDITADSSPVGTAVTYSCKDKNALPLQGDEVILCEGDGTWSGIPLECLSE